MKKIKLTGKYGKGKYALVDDENFEYLNQFVWYAQHVKRNNNYYAVRSTGGPLAMHREIMGIKDSNTLIDHADRNGLNNQKYNLRKSTYSENAVNSKKFKRKGSHTSIYKGVVYVVIKYSKKPWRARISVNGTRLLVGHFPTEIEAATAYNEAAVKHHGEFAYLNKI